MWNRTNQLIHGTYMDQPYQGIIMHSRVKLGGAVQHLVDLLDPITVFESERTSILIEETDDFKVDMDLNECYT
jgi:hypothetical protein